LCILQSVQAQHTIDGEDFTLVSPIRIKSPSKTTYATNQVDLNVTVKTFVYCRNNNMTLIYSLDKKDNVTIPLTVNSVIDVKDIIVDDDGRGSILIGFPPNPQILHSFDAEDFVDANGREVINLIIGNVKLENLQKGSHSLTVYGIYSTHQSQKIGYDKQTVHFTIDDGSGTDTGLLTSTTVYAVIVVLSLIAIVSCALFVKHRSKRRSKGKNVSNLKGNS
jgi:hypothetical protein